MAIGSLLVSAVNIALSRLSRMKSQLTRSVFRALIANQPYSSRGCLRTAHQKHYELQYRYDRPQSAHLSAVAFTSLFGFGSKKALKTNRADPGLEEMTNLAEAKSKSHQLPERAQILEAFRAFFTSRYTVPRKITANQLAVATQALKFLQEEQGDRPETEEENKDALTAMDCSKALKAMASTPTTENIDRTAELLATLLFEAILQYASRKAETVEFGRNVYSPSVKSYVEILTRTGYTRRAREMLRTALSEKTTWTTQLWLSVLNGFLTEGLQDEALKTLEEMKSMGLKIEASTFEAVNAYFVENASVKSTQTLFALAKAQSIQLTVKTRIATLILCLRLGDTAFGDKIIKDSEERHRSTEVETLKALWSARERTSRQILNDLYGRRREDTLKQPNQEKETVNALIDLYISTKDLASMDECLTYWETNKLGSSSLWLYRIQYWLDAGDVVNAYDGYHRLQSEEVNSKSQGKVNLLLTRLLAASCLSKDASYDQVMEILDIVLKQKIMLNSSTVAAVCNRLLLQGELSEIADFLTARIDNYSTSEKSLVQQEFLRVCLDIATEEVKAWEVYELFRQIFPESSVETRTNIMRSFFTRKRSDLASLVFGHMRQSEIAERRPTSDTYAECFMGIAKDGDKAALNLVHNMLKLDLEVTPTVKVTNSLMAAYAGCGMSYRSLEYFEELLNSKTGPNHSSFVLALRACETYFGDGSTQADMIMENLKKSDVDISKEIYVANICAQAANQQPAHGAHLIMEMENAVGEKPDAFVIASFYNVQLWDFQRKDAERFARKEFPDLWEELCHGPQEEDEWGNKNFVINRSILP